ncbi:Basic-leucine zipper domain [Macleaya cordata]|uniref:Basic-leucine zipper domain n=1 Tax=Macleaya cordata TaxID=56857 RepID=A0A200QE19_MACCD|nr:Basic-leucine zipper domain [Macleaya cordata]
MASSGTSSGSTSLLQNSGSEGDLQQVMDQRKKKRMLSNRESARRSRMRKQKHLDDLMAQVAQLRKENNQILTSLNITSQHYLNIESENSILRAQMGELNNRLQSLTEISHYLTANNYTDVFETEDLNPLYHYNHHQMISTTNDNTFMNPWNLPYLNQPIMASADMLQY